jgi:hypothetical protein
MFDLLMYRLLNRLFGWDYIAWRNTCDQGIARIHKDGNGVLFYWRYKTLPYRSRSQSQTMCCG